MESEAFLDLDKKIRASGQNCAVIRFSENVKRFIQGIGFVKIKIGNKHNQSLTPMKLKPS